MSDDQRTIGSIDRAGFLATAAVGTGATLLGAGPPAGLGAPHAPFVAESDARIVVERPAVQSAGRSLETYAAAPHNATATTPGVVVIQAIWGRRRAAAGRRAPPRCRRVPRGRAEPLHRARRSKRRRRGGLPAVSRGRRQARRRDGRRRRRERRRPHPHARRQARAPDRHDRLLHGRRHLPTADGRRRPHLRAASVFYGKVRYGADAGPIVPIDLAYASDVGVPVVGSWGGKDTSIKPEDVRSLDAELGQLGHVHDFKIYEEAGHAFFDDTRPSYVGSAAEDAWQRTLGWFGRYLR